MGHVGVAQDLISAGASAEAQCAFAGRTPLMLAALRDKTEMVVILLQTKASPDSTDNEGWTALMHAATAGHMDQIHQLLKYGAKVNKTSSSGNTALMEAAIWHNIEVVKYLVETAVADPELKNAEGKTALDLARESPFRERLPIVEYLQHILS
mmetsp:Transcript_12812/g.31447  ORF Transcript_12812/g.31447 Transcript_12812/m.31447 type:complete len:153 (+) Transcript_12812:516-974(+)